MKSFRRSNAFLLEIMLNIFIFAILMTVCLQMILKAHNLSKKTEGLYEAVDICQSLSDLYESGDGSFARMAEAYPSSVSVADEFYLYLDQDFAECDSADAVYHVVAASVDAGEVSGDAVTITLYDEKSEVLYSQKAYHFVPLSGKEED